MIRFGVIGAGKIAQTFSTAVNGMGGFLYAIASRDIDKAKEYQKTYGFQKAYGDYEEMLKDPSVECVYVATPHGLHYEHMMLALKHKKHILCEKSFTLNRKQAKKIFDKAKKSGCFVMEAMWTRYLPIILQVKSLVDSGRIGSITHMTVSFGFDAVHRRNSRLFDPSMGGGALLDIGVYAVTMAHLFLGIPKSCEVHVTLDPILQFDLAESITYIYDQGTAEITCSLERQLENQAILVGTSGKIVIPQFWRAETADLYDIHGNLLETLRHPHAINGFEYQIQGVMSSIQTGLLESPVVTHQMTMDVMGMMDDLRKHMGVTFPNEKA